MEGILYKIAPLEREKWMNYPIYYNYTTRSFYDVEITRRGEDFAVSFVKKLFSEPRIHTQAEPSALYEPWWEDAQAFGIAENGRISAVIETAAESWSNRLRVTQLWIDSAHHRKGIGTALMEIALRRAREEKRRAVILETQSCNEAAIAFYLNYGFTLIGFDSCAYHSDDIARKEVRIELGMML